MDALTTLGLFIPLVCSGNFVNRWTTIEYNAPSNITFSDVTNFEYLEYQSQSMNFYSHRYAFDKGFNGSNPTTITNALKNKQYTFSEPAKLHLNVVQTNSIGVNRHIDRVDFDMRNFRTNSSIDYESIDITNSITFGETTCLVLTDLENIKFKHDKVYMLDILPRLYISTSLIYYDYNSKELFTSQENYQLTFKEIVESGVHYLVPNFDDYEIPRIYTSCQYSGDYRINNFEFTIGFLQDNIDVYSKGYSDGISQGTINGYQQAVDELSLQPTLATPLGIVKSLFQSMSSLLDIQIFPNFTIGTAITLPLIAGALFLILRILKG